MKTFRFRNQWGAVRIRVAGNRYLSGREADRYGELLLLQHSGKIHDLEVHPARIPSIQERHRHVLKPAFRYTEKGKTVVELIRVRPKTGAAGHNALDRDHFNRRFPGITLRYT